MRCVIFYTVEIIFGSEFEFFRGFFFSLFKFRSEGIIKGVFNIEREGLGKEEFVEG